MGRLSLSVDWENGPERDLKLFHLTFNFLYLSKLCRPGSVAAFCGVWSGSAPFANVPNVPVQVLQITLYQQHSDVTTTRMRGCRQPLPGFRLTRGLITLVNDNYVNYLQEILAFVYYDSIVNNRPKMAEAHQVYPVSLNVFALKWQWFRSNWLESWIMQGNINGNVETHEVCQIRNMSKISW